MMSRFSIWRNLLAQIILIIKINPTILSFFTRIHT